MRIRLYMIWLVLCILLNGEIYSVPAASFDSCDVHSNRKRTTQVNPTFRRIVLCESDFT